MENYLLGEKILFDLLDLKFSVWGYGKEMLNSSLSCKLPDDCDSVSR